MATIPLGQGRRVIPGAAPAFQVDPAAYGATSGRALAELGGVGINAGLQVLDDQRRQDLADRARASKLAEDADKARGIAAIGTAKVRLQDSMRSVSNRVLSGELDGVAAQGEWDDVRTTVLSEVTRDLPSNIAQQVKLGVDQQAAELASTGIGHAVETRQRETIRANLSQALEGFERDALTDRPKAVRLAEVAIAGLGHSAGLGPDDQQRQLQQFREKTAANMAEQRYNAASHDLRALDTLQQQFASEAFADLSPDRREVLERRVETSRQRLIQQAEMAAARAQREWERRMSNAKAAYEMAVTLGDKGTKLDEGQVNEFMAVTAGTPYQASIVDIARQAKEMGGFAAQPLVEQQRTLDQLNAYIAQNGLTPELAKRRDQLEKVKRGSETAFKEDPLRAGLERGVIAKWAPLDWSHGLPGIVTQLQARIPDAQRVGVWGGSPGAPIPVTVLGADEAPGVAQALQMLAPKERASMIASFSEAMGPWVAQGIAKQVAPQDKAMALAFGYAATATPGSPETFWRGARQGDGRLVSELILRGQQAQKDGTSTKGENQPEIKKANWSAYMAEALRDVYSAQGQADDVHAAAVYIAHGIASEQGGALSKKDMDRAVRMAVGGDVVDLNGRKVPVPEFMNQDMLRRRLGSVSAEELGKQAPGGSVLAAGVPVPVDEFVKSLPGQQLLYAGPGRYAVLVGGRPVKNSAGANIIIGVH